MAKVLLFDTNVLAINPTEYQESFEYRSISIPKSVILGFELLELPDEIIPTDIFSSEYKYIEGTFVKVVQNIARDIPKEVSMRQARLALNRAGLYQQIPAILDSLDANTRDEAKIEWEFATTVAYDSPLVSVLITALNLTTTQVEDLFILAATL